jgi:actin-related protein
MLSPPFPLYPGLVLDAILQCDVDARKELYAGVVLTGGTSLISGLRDRLEREIIAGGPQAAKIKVSMPINTQERRFSVWIGGSICQQRQHSRRRKNPAHTRAL